MSDYRTSYAQQVASHTDRFNGRLPRETAVASCRLGLI